MVVAGLGGLGGGGDERGRLSGDGGSVGSGWHAAAAAGGGGVGACGGGCAVGVAMGVVGMVCLVGPAWWCGSGAHGVRRCGHVWRVGAGGPGRLLQVGPSAVSVW